MTVQNCSRRIYGESGTEIYFRFLVKFSLFGENNSPNLTKYDTMFSLNNNPTLKSRLGEQHDYAIWELVAFDGGWDD